MLAAVVTVAVACTASGDPVEAYLERLEQTLAESADEIREIVPPGTAVTRTQIVEVTEARSATLVRLEGLQPPSDLSPEHTALISTYSAFVDAAEGFLDETADEVGTAQQLFQKACQAMADRAAALGHDVSLECSG